MRSNSDSPPPPFQLGLTHAPPLDQFAALVPGIFPIPLPHPVELHVMRHGESAANAGRLITGSMNVPLTKLGKKQARQAGKKLSRSYDVAFSSTLFRSKETLQLALKARKLTAACIKESSHLAERQLGELELQAARPIAEYAAGDLLYAPRGGESYFSVTGRTLHFLTDLAKWIQNEWRLKHRNIKRILLCTHMGPMRMIAGILNGDTDPVRVLSRSYSPTELLIFHWTQVAYPRFLSDQAGRPGAVPALPVYDLSERRADSIVLEKAP